MRKKVLCCIKELFQVKVIISFFFFQVLHDMVVKGNILQKSENNFFLCFLMTGQKGKIQIFLKGV